MSSIARSKISLSKKDLTKSRIMPVGSRNTVFFHKATLGDYTINLLSMSMPSEINLSQATSEEINSARLYNNKKNLQLVSSLKGTLIQGLDYIITSGHTINLIGSQYSSGADTDEIFVGTINASPVSDIVVASSRSVTKKYNLAVSETTLNLGREYKLSEDGVLKVYVDGVLATKDTDYEEVDAGNGYGSVIEFTTAPDASVIVVDFGVLAITDNNAIGDIESLTGAVVKIAEDLADLASTSPNDYLNANPSEVERRWFGDKVLEIESRYTLDNDVVIDLASQGDFTTGSIRVIRQGKIVTVQMETGFTFPSNSNPGASAVIPTWARPSSRKINTFTVSSSVIYVMIVEPNGNFSFSFRDSSFSGSNQTAIANPDAVITFGV
jgi:hypothetical protein